MRLPLLALIPLALGAAIPSDEPCDNIPHLLDLYQGANFTGNSTASVGPVTDVNRPGASSIKFLHLKQCNPNVKCFFFLEHECLHKPDLVLHESLNQVPEQLDDKIQSHRCIKHRSNTRADQGESGSTQSAAHVSERSTAFPFVLSLYSDPNYTGKETFAGGLTRCVTGDEVPEGVSSIKFPPTDGPNHEYKGVRCFLYDNEKCIWGPGHQVSINDSTPDLGDGGIDFDNKLKAFQCFLPQGHEDADSATETSSASA
ncbi:hypothetical protein K491DRAFT_757556, partial [Lophiostoma macrostomum CBS 122681]